MRRTVIFYLLINASSFGQTICYPPNDPNWQLNSALSDEFNSTLDATNGGVFYSTNSGSSWTAAAGLSYQTPGFTLPSTNTSVNCLAVNGAGGLFAGVQSFGYANAEMGGVFYSTNSGTAWNFTGTNMTDLAGLAMTSYTVATNPPATYIFSGYNTGVYVSTNAGSSWSSGLLPRVAGNALTSYYMSPYNYLFAGNKYGVYLSTDNGVSFSSPRDTLTLFYNHNVTCLANTAQRGVNYLFAGLNYNAYAGGNNGVAFTSDNGTTWATINRDTSGHPPLTSNVYCLAANGSKVFAGCESGVYIATLSGSTPYWNSAGLANSIVYSLYYDGTNLFAGTTKGFFWSTNNGSSWKEMDAGLNNAVVQSITVSGNNLFIGTADNGVFLSTNSGGSWTALNSNLPTNTIYSIYYCSINAIPYLFASTGGGGAGVYYCTYSGSTWSPWSSTGAIGTPAYADMSPKRNISCLATNGSTVFAGTRGGLFLSSDLGLTWVPINDGLTNSFITSLAIGSGSNLYAGTYGGVFYSNNNGSSWSAANSGLTNTSVNCLAINGSNLFAGTNEGVFYSTNNGTNWTAVNSGLISINNGNRVRSIVIDSGNVFAGTDAGVFFSSNNGASWAALNTGLIYLSPSDGHTYSSSVNCLVANGTDLYAGTNGGGIFHSTNSGGAWSSWTQVNGSGSLTSLNVFALALYGNTLYAGTSPKWHAYDFCSGSFYEEKTNLFASDNASASSGNLQLQVPDSNTHFCSNSYPYDRGGIYTGGIQSHGNNFTYGYYEIRATLPGTVIGSNGYSYNFWPAFWFYYDNGETLWSNVHHECDPIDAAIYGNSAGGSPANATQIAGEFNSTVASASHVWTYTNSSGFLCSGPHNYGIEYNPNYIIFYFDGIPIYQQFGNSPTPIPQESNMMTLLINLSVEGESFYSGQSFSPAPAMLVDYFHYYTLSENCSSSETVSNQSQYSSYVPAVYSEITFSPTVSNPIAISNSGNTLFRAVGSGNTGIGITVPGAGNSAVFTVPLGTTLSLIPTGCN